MMREVIEMMDQKRNKVLIKRAIKEIIAVIER